MPDILCYLHSFATGGVERMALRLCRGWAADGVDVEVVMGRAEGHVRADDAGATSSAVIWLPFRWLPSPGFSTARFETLWMALWLPAIVRKAAPDILFCAGNSYTVVAVALRLLLGARCPVIVAKISNDFDRHDMPGPIRWLYHRWCRLQGRYIHRFVALSEAMRGEAHERLGVPRDRIEVIPDPIVSEAQSAELAEAGRHARSHRGTGRRFLAIGRLEAQKNFALLIRAFARGAGPHDRLVILGEGGERRRLECLIRRLGLDHRVVLPGHSTRIADWIARSDLFVLSSDYEGLPAVLVEALVAGLPIIATNCCRSMAETLATTNRAMLVPPRDEGALARAIASFDPYPSAREADLLLRFRAETACRSYRRLFAGLALAPDADAASDRSEVDPNGALLVDPRPPCPRDDLAARRAGAS